MKVFSSRAENFQQQVKPLLREMEKEKGDKEYESNQPNPWRKG